MKRNILIIFALLFCAMPLSAQELEAFNITGDYDRPGLTLIAKFTVTDGSHRKTIKKWLDYLENGSDSSSYVDFTEDDKFDYNWIDIDQNLTKSLSLDDRYLPSWVEKNQITHKIVSYILNRQSDGTMDDSRLRQRGFYNARATDEMTANATMLGRDAVIQDAGYELLNNNYILFVDFHTLRDGKPASVGILYKLDISEELFSGDEFAKSWVLPTDSEEVKREKRAHFDSMKFDIKKVDEVVLDTEVRRSVSSLFEDVTPYKYLSYTTKYAEILAGFEQKVSGFDTQIAVLSTKPISARIGTKESVKSRMRYDSYMYVERDGVAQSKMTAILRATTVADNTLDNTLTTEFTPIAGYGIREGYILRENKDLNAALSPYYRVGAMEGFGLNIDYLAKIKTNGAARYISLYLGYMPYNVTNRANGEFEYIELRPEVYDTTWSAISFGIKYSRAQRIARYFEASVNLGIGMDMLTTFLDEEKVSDADDFSGAVAVGSVGAALKINILYPLHLTVGVDYSVLDNGLFVGDDDESLILYNSMHSTLNDVGVNRGGLGFSVGLSLSF